MAEGLDCGPYTSALYLFTQEICACVLFIYGSDWMVLFDFSTAAKFRSLGVLLYTLVYGAMPFDGSNFKRLVKQISSGDYYEPPKPSCKNPLISSAAIVILLLIAGKPDLRRFIDSATYRCCSTEHRIFSFFYFVNETSEL